MSVPLADQFREIRERLEQIQREKQTDEAADDSLIESLNTAERARWAAKAESPLLTPQAEYYNRVVRACRRWLARPPRP